MSAIVVAPHVEIVDVDGRRFYDVDGRRLPSVHTVLEATRAEQRMPWLGGRTPLEHWRDSMGESADVVQAISQQRGLELERKVEAFLRSGDRPAGEADDMWWKSVRKVVEHIACVCELVAFQLPVVHDLDGYVGTVDLLVRICGGLHVFDWKTCGRRDKKTDRVKPRTPAELVDNFDQCAAYTDAIAWQVGERPESGQLVIALPDRAAQVRDVPLEQSLPRWRERLARFQLHAA